MAIRTFWTVLLKVIGIWLVFGSLTVIPQFLSAFPYFGGGEEDNIIVLGLVIGVLLLTIGIYLIILRLFVFRTSWLIEKLQLEKGFTEDKIEINISQSRVMQIATIVIGGFIFAESLPDLCKQIFVFFQQKSLFRESPSSAWIIFHFIKTFIGYLLMTNSQNVVDFINKKSNKIDDFNKADMIDERKTNGL